MRGMATRVLMHKASRVVVVREHGVKHYYGAVRFEEAELPRALRRAQRSRTRAVDYRARVLERLARRRHYERSLRGRLRRVFHG